MGLNNKIKNIENMFWYHLYEALDRLAKWALKNVEKNYMEQVK